MRLDIESGPSIFPENHSVATLEDRSLAEATELLHQGVRAAQAGKRPQARAALLRSAELNPRNENAWLWLASISEYPEELLVFLGNVLEIDPANTRALEWTAATKTLLSKTFVQRGIDAMQDGKRDFAAEYFHQSLEYDQQNVAAWLWLASLADSDQGKLAYLEKALAIDPDNETAHAELRAARNSIMQSQLAQAKTAAVGGRSNEAVEMIEAIVAEWPDAEEAWLLRAHLVDGFDEKLRSFRRVLDINPENAVATASLDSLTSIFETVSPSAEQIEDPVEEPAEELFVDKNPTQELEFPEPPTLQQPDDTGFEYSAVLEPESMALPVSERLSETETTHENFAAEQEQSYTVDDSPVFEPETSNQSAAGPFDSFADEHVVVETDESPISEAVSADELEHVYYEVQPDAVEESEAEVVVDYDAVASDDDSVPMPQIELSQPEIAVATGYETNVVREDNLPQKPASGTSPCPFCGVASDAQAFVCQSCMAILSLSDLEMLLGNQHADKFILRQAVERMEEERSRRAFSESELTMLGIGHLNLRNLQSGYSYLHEASQLNPNNVVLAGQVNALLIRLEEIKKQSDAHDAMPKGKKILVVDDSPTVRKLIAGKLEKCGHSVFCSADGVEAMERLQDLMPDLVLLDITMPKMDGYQVCKLIRANAATKDVPVVMISGKDGFFDKVRGRMAGTTGYITKPFGPETLMKAVEVYLKGETPAS